MHEHLHIGLQDPLIRVHGFENKELVSYSLEVHVVTPSRGHLRQGGCSEVNVADEDPLVRDRDGAIVEPLQLPRMTREISQGSIDGCIWLGRHLKSLAGN